MPTSPERSLWSSALKEPLRIDCELPVLVSLDFTRGLEPERWSRLVASPNCCRSAMAIRNRLLSYQVTRRSQPNLTERSTCSNRQSTVMSLF